MGKDLKISLLLDYYGDLLTDTQRKLADLYYNEDLSLVEIADIFHITRQGVFDSLKRTRELMLIYEDKLKLAEEDSKIKQIVSDILFECNELKRIGNETASRIGDRIEKLSERLTEDRGWSDDMGGSNGI